MVSLSSITLSAIRLCFHNFVLTNILQGKMKKHGFILLMALGISCATTEKSGLLPEDKLIVTRKYVGNFVDYIHAKPLNFGDPHLIWIKTTNDTTYGKISAYSKKCDFRAGDRIYIRRIYSSPEVFGNWEYQIENDSSVFYRVSQYQYDNKVLVQNWF
jgi:hypothetical protein